MNQQKQKHQKNIKYHIDVIQKVTKVLRFHLISRGTDSKNCLHDTLLGPIADQNLIGRVTQAILLCHQNTIRKNEHSRFQRTKPSAKFRTTNPRVYDKQLYGAPKFQHWECTLCNLHEQHLFLPEHQSEYQQFIRIKCKRKITFFTKDFLQEIKSQPEQNTKETPY